jgi:hypothetical protein
MSQERLRNKGSLVILLFSILFFSFLLLEIFSPEMLNNFIGGVDDCLESKKFPLE